MNNNDIFEIAMKQSAIDSSCDYKDFLNAENKIVTSKNNINARKYLTLPFLCDFTSYGNAVVASVSEELKEIVQVYLDKYTSYQCFDMPNLHVLSDLLKPYNMDICFFAEYFLPDTTKLKALKCDYETKNLTQKDFKDLYLPQWSNAINEKRKELDVLGIGAYDNGKLIGFAGCSADCEDMWQIGIDVLPQYRKKGIAKALTSSLAVEVLKRGKVPFYCCAWSNIKSVKNAIASGFIPAWVQVTVKSSDYIKDMNK